MPITIKRGPMRGGPKQRLVMPSSPKRKHPRAQASTKRKGSNILDAAMWSEWKTDLAPYSRSPLERLGVNMMANKKNRLLEGTKSHSPP